jgi:hypothetical protein
VLFAVAVLKSRPEVQRIGQRSLVLVGLLSLIFFMEEPVGKPNMHAASMSEGLLALHATDEGIAPVTIAVLTTPLPLAPGVVVVMV